MGPIYTAPITTYLHIGAHILINTVNVNSVTVFKVIQI